MASQSFTISTELESNEFCWALHNMVYRRYRWNVSMRPVCVLCARRAFVCICIERFGNNIDIIWWLSAVWKNRNHGSADRRQVNHKLNVLNLFGHSNGGLWSFYDCFSVCVLLSRAKLLRTPDRWDRRHSTSQTDHCPTRTLIIESERSHHKHCNGGIRMCAWLKRSAGTHTKKDYYDLKSVSIGAAGQSAQGCHSNRPHFGLGTNHQGT